MGDFELDLRAGELRRDEKTVRLQEQPFQILRMLLNAGGEVVTREELCRELWPDGTIVEFDHSINSAIRKLRRAFGDGAHGSRYVETVARRGYRLLVPAQWLALEDFGSALPELDQSDRRRSRAASTGEDRAPRSAPDNSSPTLPLDAADMRGSHKPRVRLQREPYVVIVQTPELRRRLRRLEKLVYGRMRRSRGLRACARPLAPYAAQAANAATGRSRLA
jgi:DNA-binding winged helix-turn-helix (wHTH) protein